MGRVFVTKGVPLIQKLFKDSGSRPFNCDNESTKGNGRDDETQNDNQESDNEDENSYRDDEDVSHDTNNKGQYSNRRKLMPWERGEFTRRNQQRKSDLKRRSDDEYKAYLAFMTAGTHIGILVRRWEHQQTTLLRWKKMPVGE